ncbi:MAG: hypothetical protein ACPF8V_04180 [Luteibaculum sp.]
MKYRLAFLLLTGLLSLGFALGPGIKKTDFRSGNLTCPETGNLLAKEETKMLYMDNGNTKINSVYRLAGNVFAEKSNTWLSTASYPSYQLVNHSTGALESVKPTEKGLKVSFKEDKNGELQSKTLPFGPRYAYDEELIQIAAEELDKLLANQKIKLSIVVPSRLAAYDFILEKKQSSKKSVHLILSPENFFLRQIVNPIELWLNPEDKSLQRVKGITNVLFKETGTRPVEINYTEDPA